MVLESGIDELAALEEVLSITRADIGENAVEIDDGGGQTERLVERQELADVVGSSLDLTEFQVSHLD